MFKKLKKSLEKLDKQGREFDKKLSEQIGLEEW